MKIDTSDLPKSLIKLLRGYGLIKSARGNIPETTLRAEVNGRPLGTGPIIDPTALQRMIDADKSPDKHWVPWILHLAGGGDQAKRKAQDLFSSMRLRWVDTHIRGYEDKKGVYHPPVSREEAEASWEAKKDDIKDRLNCADQDVVNRYMIFGWYRHWPGKDRMYERTSAAVEDFWKLYRKIKVMNAWLDRNDKSNLRVSVDPKDYDSVDALERALKRVRQFYASRKARSDVRAVKIYDDPNLRIVAPLTYAAAVRLGWNQWPWADEGKFDRGMEGSLSNFEDSWRRGAAQNVYVYYHFKSPVPTWVTQNAEGKPNRYYYTNLALELTHADLKAGNVENAKVYDEENRRNTTLETVWDAIEQEPTRNYDPEQEEFPIHQGPPVYASKEEADAVLDSLSKGTEAVRRWARTFDPSQLVADYIPQ